VFHCVFPTRANFPFLFDYRLRYYCVNFPAMITKFKLMLLKVDGHEYEPQSYPVTAAATG
jgi:hypothetical protein